MYVCMYAWLLQSLLCRLVLDHIFASQPLSFGRSLHHVVMDVSLQSGSKHAVSFGDSKPQQASASSEVMKPRTPG